MAQQHDGADGAGDLAAGAGGDGQVLGTDGDGLAVLLDEVHLTDEGGHMHGSGGVVDLGGRADLLELALVHDHDPVGQGHGLLLVVGHEDDRDAQVALNLLQFFPHLLADLGVQGGEGLIQKQQGGLEQQGAGNGDTLLLAAGELAGILLLRSAHRNELQDLLDVLVDGRLGDLPQLQAEGQVLIDRHVGPEVVALEHHGGGALFGRQVDNGLSIHQDIAGSHIQETADGPQDGRFAAAGGAQKGNDFTLIDFEIDMLNAVAVVIPLGHIFDLKFDFTLTHIS